MKKILIALLVLLGALNTINCMEQKEEKFEYFQYLPPELRCKIIATILEENLEESLDKWDDIFNFDRNSLKEVLDEIRLVSKDFVVPGKEDLEKFIRNLRKNRLSYFEECIKGRYKDLSEEDLNKKLRIFLNIRMAYKDLEDLKESVRLIIAGVDIDSKDNCGRTVLMYAAMNGHAEILRLLIDKGAAIGIQDNNGWTALMWAAIRGHAEIARVLIDKGADKDIQDNDGRTALMFATGRAHTEIARLLIEKGADIDIKNNNGSTALMLAAKWSHAKIVSLLGKKD